MLQKERVKESRPQILGRLCHSGVWRENKISPTLGPSQQIGSYQEPWLHVQLAMLVLHLLSGRPTLSPHGTFTNPACTPCHCETEREHFARPVSPSCSLPYLPPLVTKVPAFFGSSSLHYFWGVGWARGESRLIFSLSWGRAETSEGKSFSVPFLFKFLCVNYGIFQFLLQKQSPQHETIGRIGDRLINMNHSI